MGLIEWYVLFCLTTAIVGIMQIYAPIHKKLKENHASNICTKAPILSNIVFLVFGIITAPILFIILMLPPVVEIFIESMYTSLIAPQGK